MSLLRDVIAFAQGVCHDRMRLEGLLMHDWREEIELMKHPGRS